MRELSLKDWLIHQLVAILLSIAYVIALAWRGSTSRLRKAARTEL